MTRSFDVFFDLRLNKLLSKQWWGWWFETPSRPLWRHCNGRWKFCYELNIFLNLLFSLNMISHFIAHWAAECRIYGKKTLRGWEEMSHSENAAALLSQLRFQNASAISKRSCDMTIPPAKWRSQMRLEIPPALWESHLRSEDRRCVLKSHLRYENRTCEVKVAGGFKNASAAFTSQVQFS